MSDLLGRLGESSAPLKEKEPSMLNSGDSDKNFQVALAIYTGTVITGLTLLGESDAFSRSWWYGVIYALGGGLGATSIAPSLRSKLAVMRLLGLYGRRQSPLGCF